MAYFKEKFNKATDSQFDYLRLSKINISIAESIAEFCFVAPEEFYEKANDGLNQILKGVESAFVTDFNVSVKVKKSHFDEYFFGLDIIDFFDSIPSLKGCVSKRDIFFKSEENKHFVEIVLKKSEYSLFCGRNLIKDLKDLICGNYCENISIEIKQSSESEEFIEDESETFIYDDSGGRVIDVTNIEALTGLEIYDKPNYISDAINPIERAVLCGRIIDIKQIERKVSSDGKKKPNFFKFFLEDPTGRISCVYFPSEKTLEKAKLLQNDKEILVVGKLEFNEFMGNKTMQMLVRSICFCVIPKDFKINRLKFRALSNYKYITPQPYIEYNQGSIFDKAKKPAKFFMGKEIVVFDLETTGLNPLADRIIEIGAVKIKDGNIVETFSSFVDPQRPLTEKIINLTGITDQDLKDAYLINEVLLDFYKFCSDVILVGHNSENFDFPFLSAEANKFNIYFDNKRLDTMVIAGQYLKLKNLKLQTLAQHFNIKNEQAHRAVFDAITTAKLLMHLGEFINDSDKDQIA